MKTKFKIGDWIHYKGEYEGYLHVEDIEKFNGVTYYHEKSSHSFVTDADFLKKVDSNDEKFKRYKLYLELKKEFG